MYNAYAFFLFKMCSVFISVLGCVVVLRSRLIALYKTEFMNLVSRMHVVGGQ